MTLRRYLYLLSFLIPVLGLLLFLQGQQPQPKMSLGIAQHLGPPRYSLGLGGTIGIGTPTPDDPIVVKNPVAPHNELYRLRADGTEWYAPDVSPEWVQGRLFQLLCPANVWCL